MHFFFFNDTATTEIYTLSLHDALPILRWTNAKRGQQGEPTLILWTDAGRPGALASVYPWQGNLIYECVSLARGERSEEHTSELQSRQYLVCRLLLEKKKKTTYILTHVS